MQSTSRNWQLRQTEYQAQDDETLSELLNRLALDALKNGIVPFRYKVVEGGDGPSVQVRGVDLTDCKGWKGVLDSIRQAVLAETRGELD